MALDLVFDAMVVEMESFFLCELAPRGWLTMPRSGRASLHYVLAGNGGLHVPGQLPIAIQAGDLVLVPAGQSHSLGAADGAFVSLANCQPAALGLQHHRVMEGADTPVPGLVVLCAHFTVGLRGAGPVIDLLRKPIVERGQETLVAKHAIDLIVGELRHPGLGGRAMIRALLLQCLIDTLRHRVVAGDQAVAWIPALSDRRLWPALSAILDAPGALHTVESLAERVGMSRSRFAERFHRSFGSSPMEIVRGLRLQFAARLLLESDAGIARVAQRSGYSSRSHFSQQFEVMFGKSPGRYRKDAAQKD
jgi:AraC-like DNA-binding protein